MTTLATILAIATTSCPPGCGPAPLCVGACFAPATTLFEIADWNQDCELSDLDIVAFATDYFEAEGCADFNCDLALNPDDLADFIAFFAAHANDPPPC